MSYSDTIFISHLPCVCIRKVKCRCSGTALVRYSCEESLFLLQRTGKINLKFSTGKNNDNVSGGGGDSKCHRLATPLKSFEKKEHKKWREVAASLGVDE